MKLLRDREYYASLNTTTGRWINVFHAGVKFGHKEARLQLDHREAQYREIIENLRSEFLENQNPKNPLVFFFYVKENEIAETIVFKISDGSAREIYEELRLLLDRVKDSIRHVEAENASNYEAIFDLQRIGVDAIKMFTFVKSVQKLPIIGFLGLLKRLML